MNRKWIIIPILVFALIVVCVAIGGIVYVTLAPTSSSRISLFNNGNPFTQSVQETEQKNFPVNGEAYLTLDNIYGDITITTGDVSEIQVTANKTAWGATDEKAQEAMDQLIVNMTQTDNQVTIYVEQPELIHLSTGATQSNMVVFEIVVPAETTVDASTNFGDVSLTGTQGKATLESDFGDVTIFDFKGGLLATSSSGNVTARSIQLLDSGFGDVSLQSDFGEITLEDAITQKVDVFSRNGDLELTNVNADEEIKLTTDFGEISFRSGKAGTLTLETSSGEVTLVDLSVSGLLTAKSSFGKLDLTEVEASSYDLNTNNGTVTVNGASGTLKVRSDFGGIQIENGEQVTLDLETSNGQIQYFGSLGEGPHNLHTDFGDITLTMPADAAFNFDLETDFGDIQSAYPVSINGEPDETHWVGEVNGGGASLNTSTNSGSIQLAIGE